jgi:hypothetical protein
VDCLKKFLKKSEYLTLNCLLNCKLKSIEEVIKKHAVNKFEETEKLNRDSKLSIDLFYEIYLTSRQKLSKIFLNNPFQPLGY